MGSGSLKKSKGNGGPEGGRREEDTGKGARMGKGHMREE